MIERLLKRLTAWLERKMGLFELTEPVVVQSGTGWLRIDPNGGPRWFRTESEAERG